jgi:hypothetical protein
MKLFVVRFRYILPFDDCTPFVHLPIEETHIHANSPEEAWEALVSKHYGGGRENFYKEEIYEKKTAEMEDDK